MTELEKFVFNYNELSVADLYVLGFCYNHSLYEIVYSEIPIQYMKLDHASSKKGGYATLRMRLTKEMKQDLIEKGAEYIGTEELLQDSKYNKGEIFERLFTEKMEIEWIKDSLPFWKGGDIEKNGIKYQIKFDGATIATDPALKKAIAEKAIA